MDGLRERLSWLANLPSRVERIANFGCWSGGEPFALLWTLDAKEVTVVEIEGKFIEGLREQLEIVELQYPESLRCRSVTPLCVDMTSPIPELPDRYFDLAYCEDVLYTLPLGGDTGPLERGILQMIRVVKPNGFVIAVEPKFGAKFETRKLEGLGIAISTPVQISEPKDMSDLFSSHGLRKIDIPSCPPHAYCYQKINQ